jgi:hypothetical protein
VLPLLLKQGNLTRPVVETSRPKRGDELTLAVNAERRDEVEALRVALGAERVGTAEPESPVSAAVAPAG